MDISNIVDELVSGECIPYLGLGIFEGVNAMDGTMMPHNSDSLILALNNGRAMSPRLMYEFSRAAMSLEQRKGRVYIEGISNLIFSKEFEAPVAHQMIKKLLPSFIVDSNRDGAIQKLYEGQKHYMVHGISRIGAELKRYESYFWDGQSYEKVDDITMDLPVIFKPMGTVSPTPSFIISDADYVDWLTEAMGGFAMPSVLKKYRKGKKFLFLGQHFNRDTDRMVANEITLGLESGYLVCDKELTKAEKRFVDKHNVVVIPVKEKSFLQALLEVLEDRACVSC